MIIKAAKRIFNSDKICHSYSDLNFGVTFLEHSVYTSLFVSNKVHGHNVLVITGDNRNYRPTLVAAKSGLKCS